MIICILIIGDQNDRQGLSSPSPSWINQRALQNHDSMLVCTYTMDLIISRVHHYWIEKYLAIYIRNALNFQSIVHT
jgi:hypothetical protein